MQALCGDNFDVTRAHGSVQNLSHFWLELAADLVRRSRRDSSTIDFIGEIKNLLSKQREATDKEAKDFERFRFLLEDIGNLKRQLPKTDTYYYDSERDKTFNISIDKVTYNDKLNKIEVELIRLCKKYSFLEMPTISYKEILRRLNFEDWKSENNVEFEDEWSNFDDEEKEEYDGDFENFLKWGYDEYLLNNDFDE